MTNVKNVAHTRKKVFLLSPCTFVALVRWAGPPAPTGVPRSRCCSPHGRQVREQAKREAKKAKMTGQDQASAGAQHRELTPPRVLLDP